MENNDKINLSVDVDYKNIDVKSKLSGDRNNYVSYIKTMSESEKKVLKKMITTEYKQLVDPLNAIKMQKPKLDQETKNESAKDKLIKVLQTENAELKKTIVKLEARIVELEAENAQLKAEIVELKVRNDEQSNQITELMTMNKALLARLELQGK